MGLSTTPEEHVAAGTVPQAPLTLGGHIEEMREKFPDEVLTIDKEVDIDCGVTSLFTQLERENKFPIIVINKPVYKGRRHEFPVVTGLYASRARLARLIGADQRLVAPEFARRLTRPVAPVVVDREDASVKSTVIREQEVDLHALPAPRHNPMDPGQYLSGGFLTTYSKSRGIENSAIQRAWIKDSKELRIYMNRPTHNYRNYEEYEAANEPMPAAYWVGHHPLHVLGCETRGRLDHWEASGAIAESPLRVVPSETLGADFMVPADAEFVIEGYVLPHERRPEGPFGEYPMYYGPQHHNPVMMITAITHRPRPMWDCIVVGHTHWLAAFQREGNAYDHVRRSVPQVTNVYLPRRSAGGCLHVYVQLKATGSGQSRSALVAALTVDPLVKHAFVVDDDVNIFDDRDVMWAMATRFQADRDVITIPGMLATGLDPSNQGRALGSKAGFDCTRGVPEDRFAAKIDLPEEYATAQPVAGLATAEKLASIPRDELS
jgi:2,5-furandicarboxylate decarboxylase 1